VHGGGLGKLHGESTAAKVAPELLSEQHFDIRLIVNHENEQVHARSPDLISDAAARGRTILKVLRSLANKFGFQVRAKGAI
jgi:hypothetical protein